MADKTPKKRQRPLDYYLTTPTSSCRQQLAEASLQDKEPSTSESEKLPFDVLPSSSSQIKRKLIDENR